MDSQLPAKHYITTVLKALYFQDFTDDASYDLIITIDSDDIVFREFGAFLMIVDRFYGRLQFENFNSYSQSERKHLKISEIQQGSTLLTLKDFFNTVHTDNAILFFLLIKFLKSALSSGSSALVKISKAYETYEKSRLTRIVRKSLKEDMGRDEVLRNLNEKDLSKLVNILEKRYTQEKKYLLTASKFARKKMKNVDFKKQKIT